MLNNSNINVQKGYSCITIIASIFLFIAWVWGLSTPWGNFELDIFPPKITTPYGEIKSL